MKIFTIFFLIMGIGFSFITISAGFNTEDEIKRIDCYDSHDNKIEGLTCIKEIDREENICLCIVLSLFLMLVGIFFGLKFDMILEK